MYTLFTDTDTDINLVEAKEYGIKLISMPYIIDGKAIKPYEDFETFDSKSYYDMLRGGGLPSTCGISPQDYINYFEPEFKEGKDVLYVHFSRRMSGTFMSLDIALEELKEKYPDRKCYLLDTKGITLCSYSIVTEIAKMYKNGAKIEEILKWGEKEVDHFATYFFADDLKFFKKSGRVSNIAAFFGGIIGVRPLLTMNNDGEMKSIGKVKGKVNAINALVKYVEDLGVDLKSHQINIGHADALSLAESVKNALVSKFGDDLNIKFVEVNPTAGAHCGPDTVGVSFYAKNR